MRGLKLIPFEPKPQSRPRATVRGRHAAVYEDPKMMKWRKQVTDYIGNSRVVLDLPHPMQTGLTMRTIEAIGSKKKLITTNVDIVNYDFYNPKNILLIERENINFDKSFFIDLIIINLYCDIIVDQHLNSHDLFKCPVQ